MSEVKQQLFLDTNIFLRVLTHDDQTKYVDSLQLLQEIKEGLRFHAYTSTVVLAEVQWTLAKFYKKDKSTVIAGLRSLCALAHLTVQDRHILPFALELYERYPIKFIDAIIATDPAIQNRTYTIVSYDKDFDLLKLDRKEPNELI
jgi:predicted nucleic-acid-binding protein